MFTKNDKGKLQMKDTVLRIETPDVIALARTVDDTISASAEITLNELTTMIRVVVAAKDVFLKWGTDNVTAANFDECIQADTYMDFIVPANITAVNLIERAATATVVVIEK